MKVNPIVSVVIPTHRRVAGLRELLGSLERQNKSVEFEVLVVANLPEPGLKKVVESYGPRFRFLETGRLGNAIARNKGLERARGEVVLLLDDEGYLPDRDFVARTRERHLDFPQAAAIGGPYGLREGAKISDVVRFLVSARDFRAARGRFDETSMLHGANWSFKAHALGSKPKFDETFSSTGSELELFSRLRSKGHSLVACDDLAIVRRTGTSVWGLLRESYSRGITVGRLEPEVNRTRHWNSTVITKDIAEDEGIAWSYGLALLSILSEKAYTLGLAAGRRPVAKGKISLRLALTNLWPGLRRSSLLRTAREIRVLFENAARLARIESTREN